MHCKSIRAQRMAQKRGNEDLGLVAAVGVKRATSMLVKSACVMTLIEMEAADELERQAAGVVVAAGPPKASA